MSDHTDELLALVKDNMDDIIHDQINHDRVVPLPITSKTIHMVDGGDDDGATYGTFRIVVNDGQFYIDVEASAVFQSFRDRWDNSSESHYTRDVYFDELQGYEHEAKCCVEVKGGQNVISSD